jgi:hypothetical protein
MNVKQLRNLLLDYEDDVEILIAEDEEGNSFSRLVEMSMYWIYPGDDAHGRVEDVYDVPLGVEDGYDRNFEPRLVLWP